MSASQFSCRCFSSRSPYHLSSKQPQCYKARSIQTICCVNIHPACSQSQGTFHVTADDDHPHGSFVGQYCQGQAQEIVVEVILCKYSRHHSRAQSQSYISAVLCSAVCKYSCLLFIVARLRVVFRYPEGCAAPSFVPCQCYTRESLSKLERTSPHVKINVTSKSPVGDISVVTLIRTDTTLDHSQKAEKV